MKLELSTTPWN